MEVSSENFWRQLPKILLSIAKSRYVAIDVEMTGIMDKGSENRHDNPTNQQTYESAKNIASKFNVFELGITCVEKSSGLYFHRPHRNRHRILTDPQMAHTRPRPTASLSAPTSILKHGLMRHSSKAWKGAFLYHTTHSSFFDRKASGWKRPMKTAFRTSAAKRHTWQLNRWSADKSLGKPEIMDTTSMTKA